MCLHASTNKESNKISIRYSGCTLYECTIYMICSVHVLQHKNSNVLCNKHFQVHVHTSQSLCVYMHPQTKNQKKKKKNRY